MFGLTEELLWDRAQEERADPCLTYSDPAPSLGVRRLLWRIETPWNTCMSTGYHALGFSQYANLSRNQVTYVYSPQSICGLHSASPDIESTSRTRLIVIFDPPLHCGYVRHRRRLLRARESALSIAPHICHFPPLSWSSLVRSYESQRITTSRNVPFARSQTRDMRLGAFQRHVCDTNAHPAWALITATPNHSNAFRLFGCRFWLSFCFFFFQDGKETAVVRFCFCLGGLFLQEYVPRYIYWTRSRNTRPFARRC